MKDEQGEFEPVILTPDSLFSWADFHKLLDKALVPYLEEGGSVNDSIVDFAKYSNSRRYTPKMLMDDLTREEGLER